MRRSRRNGACPHSLLSGNRVPPSARTRVAIAWRRLDELQSNEARNRMAKIDWSKMARRSTRSHLIMVLLAADERDTRRRRRARELLFALTQLCQSFAEGPYAVAISRQANRTALQCAFEQAADARRVAKALRAAPQASSEPWASVHLVLLKGDSGEAALAVAGPARKLRPTPIASESGFAWTPH
jgi:hypothetical protein